MTDLLVQLDKSMGEVERVPGGSPGVSKKIVTH